MALKGRQVQIPRPPEFDEILGAALAYASDGIPVFPCSPETKKPFTLQGFKDATIDQQVVEKFWHRWPAAMIGMPTGPMTARWALDIDAKDGRDGRATLAAFEREHGKLPPTLTTLTPSGGEHRFFRWQDEHAIASRPDTLGPGLDTRGAGGYVILPPSMRQDGATYRWDPTYTKIANAPEWLVTACAKPASIVRNKTPTPSTAPVTKSNGGGNAYARTALEREIQALAATQTGGRNSALNIASLKLHQLVAAGELDENEVVDRLMEACRENGLISDDGEDACLATIASGARKGKEEPREIPKQTRRRGFIKNTKSDEKKTGNKKPAATTTKKAAPPGGLEDAIALEFAEQHAHDLRYVAMWNRWLQYDGVRWRIEETLGAFDLARKLCREADDADAKTVAAVITLARADRRLAATSDQWDADPWRLGTPAGEIDLRTGKMFTPNPERYITKITAAAPGGDCLLWHKFLKDVTGGNADLQSFLQRVCGYALTGATSEDALFFFYGTGANGKSVFLKTIAGILDEYHKTAPIETFTVSNSDKHPTDLAMLRGARLVTATETEEGKRWDETKIKALTGGDRIAARFMRQDFFEYVPQFKLLIAGNHRPGIRTVDEAIRRRMNLIPFTVTIPKDKRDPDLADKLKSEWSAILKWMIQGCLAWQRDGLQPPKAVREATDSYLSAEDVLQAFIVDCCTCGPKYDDTLAHLWAGWKDWAIEAGEYVGTKRKFSDRLEDKGFRRSRGTAGSRKHIGIWCVRETQKAAVGSP
jgi:putative DNA primase/helicase